SVDTRPALRPSGVHGCRAALARPRARPRTDRRGAHAVARRQPLRDRRARCGAAAPMTTASLPLRRGIPMVGLCFAGMIAAIICAPLIGSTSISLTRVFDMHEPFADNVDAQIFFIARLPRAVAAALVGGTLAAAGVVFQGLLRNPLATPYTLGVS